MIRSAPVLIGALALMLGCSGEDDVASDGGSPHTSGADAGIADGAPDGADGSAAEPDEEDEESTICPTPSSLVEALRNRALELDERSRALDERENSLKQLGEAIDTRLANLEKAKDLATVEVERLADIRAGKCREAEQACTEKIAKLRQEYDELERGLASWDEAQKQSSSETRDAEVVRLTKALTTMRPEKAAATLAALDSETAALLLSQIPERSSGKILAALDPSKTASIVGMLLEKSAPASRDALREVAHNTKTETKTNAEERDDGDSR